MANPKYVLTIDGKQFRFQEDQTMGNYTLTLEKLSYDKGIYRPAEMKVTINVGGQGVKNNDLVSAFHQKPVQLTINGETVADSFFVFKVMPLFKKVSNGSNVKLELTIYSLDKLLAIDKYSKAWTGQKLGKDIFTKEVESFKLQVPTKCDLQVVEYNKEVGTDEFVQPYLVQYNESFYDFMRRTANRCGEFLYYENGKLQLGMQMTDKAGSGDPDYAQIAAERHYENLLCEGIKTTDFAYNYLTEDRSMPNKDDKPYSNPLTYDDYLDDVKRDYTDVWEQFDYLSKNIVNSLCLALGGTSLLSIIENLIFTNGFKLLHATTATANMNQKHMDGNITPWAGIEEQNGDKVRQFGTYKDQKPKNDFCGQKINMNAEFYALIREAEKKVGENAVYLDFGDDTQKLSIGDKIKVDCEYYVVIGVNGSCEFIHTDDSKKATYDERQQVIGVKLYGEAAIPPALPDIVIRESQPQLAFVIDNFDPEKFGRVRVKFAWQPKEGDDNKENASPWIRVSLPFATDGGGVKFKPEKGDEVMVSFEEGNVERPYVSGFLLSPRTNKTWSWLPDRTITSKNGHTITFSDGIDGASSLYALSPFWKLVKSFIPNAAIPPALSDDAIFRGLTGGMTLSDRFGLYKINLSSDSRSVFIQSPVGDVTLNAFTGINISAPNGDISIQGKNIKLAASDTVTIESGKAVKQRFLPGNESYGESGTFWDSTAGRVIADVSLTFIRGIRSRTIDKVVDVKLVRTLMDTVLRPIDGTLKIKSPTFVRIEAGKGSAEYPRAARRKNGDVENVPFDFYPSITKIASIACSRVESIQATFDSMCKGIESFNNASRGVNENEQVISVATIKNASYQKTKSDLNFNWPEELKTAEELMKQCNDDLQFLEDHKPNKNDDKYTNNELLFQQDMKEFHHMSDLVKSRYTNAREQLDKTQKARKALEDKAKNLSERINTLYWATHINFNADVVDCENLFFANSIKGALKSLSYDKEIPIAKTTTKLSVNDWAAQKKHYMRLAVCSFFSQRDVSDKVFSKVNNKFMTLSEPTGGTDDLANDINWQACVGSMVRKPTAIEKIRLMEKEWADETYKDPYEDPIVNQHRWKVGVDGKILMSDNPGKTMTFGNNGLVHATDNMAFTSKSCDELKNMLCSIGTNV